MIIKIVMIFVIGLIMGLLANNQARFRGFGLERSIMSGLVGAHLGGLLNMTGIIKGVLGIKIGGILGIMIWATIGAVIVLFIVSLFRRRPSESDY